MVKSTANRKPTSLNLEERLAAIGIMVSARSLATKEIEAVDIEHTLVDAIIYLGKNDSTLRLLNPILSWVAEHGSAVIIEKLIKILMARLNAGENISYVWLISKMAQSRRHKRWATVIRQFAPDEHHRRILGPLKLGRSLLALRGEEQWSRGSGFLVPQGSTEVNSKWTLSRTFLCKQSHQYRNRLIYGAQWRADIITAYERGADTPTEASRMSGASYEPCHRVRDELIAAGILKAKKKV